jgi:hypothetical protein
MLLCGFVLDVVFELFTYCSDRPTNSTVGIIRMSAGVCHSMLYITIRSTEVALLEASPGIFGGS